MGWFVFQILSFKYDDFLLIIDDEEYFLNSLSPWLETKKQMEVIDEWAKQRLTF